MFANAQLSDPLLPRPRLSIVVPCYNEEACLETLHRRLTEQARTAVGEDYEIVLVDDGSKDRTWPMMRALGETDPHVRALRLSRNHGHQLALSAGLDLCRGELILIIDADLQDPPELLGAMIARMEAEEADVVYGVRTQRLGETVAKRATAKLFYRLLAHLSDGVEIPLDTGDFRLMSRRALDVLQAMPERSRFIRGMVAWIGFKQVAIEYQRDERFAGETNYPFVKMIRLAVDALTGFSVAPLRLASYAGFAFSLLSLALIAYSLIGWLGGHTVPGWTSLMIVVLVLGSVQLFVLGLLGEYLGRLYHQAKGRPLYIVSEMAVHPGAMAPLPQARLGVVTAHPPRP
ncbi:glycosyltransferase family 2 protein [Novosphingobium cyanobacteriorum]|uniref:Glycosyltransferase family 2 protein n=1 Tax=Novosphingobium cyanobacteriorum TaxID=3024215 RepID=A0ABT6CH17_9SPHN|nr:glycosyltransferase family 2 protein [Novosphingobium cyanobacteriorum]MDF8331637.1 glycosyltransferase family 2 protein [Novosphingobium cyanobacteriorum]